MLYKWSGIELWSYCDARAAEGLGDALQVVWQKVQQAGGQEDSSSEAADQTQQPAAQICNKKNRTESDWYCRLTAQSKVGTNRHTISDEAEKTVVSYPRPRCSAPLPGWCRAERIRTAAWRWAGPPALPVWSPGRGHRPGSPAGPAFPSPETGAQTTPCPQQTSLTWFLCTSSGRQHGTRSQTVSMDSHRRWESVGQAGHTVTIKPHMLRHSFTLHCESNGCCWIQFLLCRPGFWCEAKKETDYTLIFSVWLL